MVQFIEKLFEKCNKFILLSFDKILDDIKVCFGDLFCRELLKVIKLFILL